MSLVLKSFRRKRTFSSLRSLNTVFNLAFGVLPYSLREKNVVFGIFRLPFNIFSTFILPFLGGYVLIYPNHLLKRSSFSILIFTLQFVPYCSSILAFLFCNIFYRADIASATSQLIRIERMFIVLDVEPKIHASILKEAVMPLLVVVCSAG